MEAGTLALTCLFAMVAIGALGWSLFRALRNNVGGRSEPARLAEEGGYALMVEGAHDVQNVYAGQKNSRTFAYRLIQDVHRTNSTDGRRNVRVLKIQVLLPLQNPKFADFRMVRNSKLRGVPETFDEIWVSKPSADVLSRDEQETIYEFAAGNPHPAGNSTGNQLVSLSKSPRKLSIVARDQWGENVPKDLFADAVSLMAYDHPKALIETEEFEALLQELTILANSVDT
ncbi:MAG: hypothetical protein AAGD96_27375 [Chloroflexota bacterium]